MWASTSASSLDTRSRKWKYAQAPAASASTSMPSTMNLTGERRGSSARGSGASGLREFDNSSITSGILIITFPHMHVASRVPDPSGSPTGSSGWTFTYRPLRGAAGCAAISALYSPIACLHAWLRFRPSTLDAPLGAATVRERSLRYFGTSFHYHRSANRRNFTDQEHQRDDHQKQHAHDPERVGKGQHAGLLQQRAVHHPLRLRRRVGGRCPPYLERHRRLPQGVPVGRIVGRQVRDQHRLVKLGAARQHGGGGGDPRTAADVARQIVQAGGVVHALARNPQESHGADGHEYKGQPETLYDAAAHRGGVIQLQGEAGHGDQPRRGYRHAEDDQPARLISAQQHSHRGHGDADDNSAGRKHQPAEHRRIPQQRLQEKRQ